MAWQKIVPYMAAGTKDIEDVYETKLCMAMIFQIDAKSEKQRNMRNRIRENWKPF